MTEHDPNASYELPPDVQAMIDAGNAVRAGGIDPSIIQAESADDKSYSAPQTPLSEVEKTALARSQAILAKQGMHYRTPKTAPTVRDEIVEIRRKRYSDNG